MIYAPPPHHTYQHAEAGHRNAASRSQAHAPHALSGIVQPFCQADARVEITGSVSSLFFLEASVLMPHWIRLTRKMPARASRPRRTLQGQAQGALSRCREQGAPPAQGAGGLRWPRCADALSTAGALGPCSGHCGGGVMPCNSKSSAARVALQSKHTHSLEASTKATW